jgi:predicted Zn-dependent protease with MMP-like domain
MKVLSLGGGIKPRYVLSMSETCDFAPSLADIDALARAAYQSIPEEFTRFAGDVVVRVVDFPDKETMREMGLETPFDLLGLYRGVPIGEKVTGGSPQDVDMILLYRRPLLDYWCETDESLARLIRHVLVHEIGHHFGLSDNDMARIEDGAD